MMLNLVSIASLILVIAILLISVPFYWRYYKLRHIPGPFSVPIVSLITLCTDIPSLINTLDRLVLNYGDFFKAWLGPKLIFVITKPEFVKVVLSSPESLEKGSGYKFMGDFLGDGVFTATTEAWKSKRKLIAPSFSPRVLNSYFAIVNNCSSTLVSVLNRDQSDILNAVTNCFVDITVEAFLGCQVNAMKQDLKIAHTIERLDDIAILRNFKFWLQPDVLFRRSRYYKKYKHDLEIYSNFAEKIVYQRLEAVEKIGNNDDDDDENRHFLTNLIKNYRDKKITLEDVMGEAKTMIFGGSETTSGTICFILTFLGIELEVQRKVYCEIIENIGNEDITPENMKKLVYTECVIKEGLRLAPPGMILMRKVTRKLNIDKFALPKGAEIAVLVLHLHKSPKYWTDPSKFIPERFLGENASHIQPNTYIPFSVGPRNCLGQKFALDSMKVLVAHLVRNFEISSEYERVEDVELLENMTTKPRYGFKLKLTQRS